MRYEGRIYRPPSEAEAYILQATIGCSWNHCTYCDMYRDKSFRVRPLAETLTDLKMAGAELGRRVDKVFVADGDALILSLEHWQSILTACSKQFGPLKRISCYATAMNLLEKSEGELAQLREMGLTRLYIGPETGDDTTFKRIAKGADAAAHKEAAQKAKAAGFELSAIFLLGAGGVARSQEHAEATARLIGDMDPDFVSCLTLTVVETTPLAVLQERGKFELPSVERMLEELRVIVAGAEPTNAVFRSNHASNYLPLRGNLPQDRDSILAVIDAALAGELALRPEWARSL